MSQLSLANEDILGSLVKNTQNDAKKFFKERTKQPPPLPAISQPFKIFYKTDKKRLLTCLSSVIYTNGYGSLTEERPLFNRSPKTILVPWLGVDKNNLDYADNIMIDIDAESTLLPVFCKILIINHGAVRINSPMLIERDVSVQVGEPNDWLLSYKNTFFNNNNIKNKNVTSYGAVPLSQRERTLSSTVTNEYYSAPLHKYRGKQANTNQKEVQVQDDMFYSKSSYSSHQTNRTYNKMANATTQKSQSLSTEDLISYLKLNVYSKEEIMSPYSLEPKKINLELFNKIIENKMIEKRTRRFYNQEFSQKLSTEQFINGNNNRSNSNQTSVAAAKRYEDSCPITGTRRLRLLMPFVNAITNLSDMESNASKTIVNYDYVEDNETVEKLEDYFVTDSCVDTQDLDKHLKLNSCTHLQLLSEAASLNDYLSGITVEDLTKHLNHLSQSSESLYDNLRANDAPSESNLKEEIEEIVVNETTTTNTTTIEIKNSSFTEDEKLEIESTTPHLSRSFTQTSKNHHHHHHPRPNFDHSPISPVEDRPPRSPRSPLARSPHGRSPLASSPVSRSPVSSRSPIRPPVFVASNANGTSSTGNLLSAVKTRNDKRNSSGASIEKKRLSWADELIFSYNDDENSSPRPPLCQTYELYEQFHTTDSRSSEDKSTTTTDFTAPAASVVDDHDNEEKCRKEESKEEEVEEKKKNNNTNKSFSQQVHHKQHPILKAQSSYQHNIQPEINHNDFYSAKNVSDLQKIGPGLTPQIQKQTFNSTISITTTTKTNATTSILSPKENLETSNGRKTSSTVFTPTPTPVVETNKNTDSSLSIPTSKHSTNPINLLSPKTTSTENSNNFNTAARQRNHIPTEEVQTQQPLNSQSSQQQTTSNLSLSNKATNAITQPPKDDYDISDILARYNISKQSLEKPRKIKLRKDSESNIKNIIESIDTKLEKINKCTAPQAAAAVNAATSGALIVDTCNYHNILGHEPHHTHLHPHTHLCPDGNTIFDLSCINSESIHNSETISMLNASRIPSMPLAAPSPISPTSGSIIACSTPGCIHHRDYYTNCARYPLISRAVGGKHMCLSCETNSRNGTDLPKITNSGNNSGNYAPQNINNSTTSTNTNRPLQPRRRSGSEYSMPSLELNHLDPHHHHQHHHQSHARTLSANRADDLSHNYYMHESSTPRTPNNKTIEHQIPTNSNNAYNDQKSSKNRSIKKSNSLRAGSFYSRFDELIKNTCELVNSPFDATSTYRFDFDDCLDKNFGHSRYFRSDYDKSLLAYADGITHSLSSTNGLLNTKNNSNDDDITDELIADIHKEDHPKVDQNTSNEETTNTNTNANLTISIDNDTNNQVNMVNLDDAHREDTSNSSFFDVSKKSHSASADSTLEVETDYCNESFII